MQPDDVLITDIEARRLEATTGLDAKHRSDYGQFFTPQSVAEFMSSLFTFDDNPVKLLDPGAGIGLLTAAFAKHAGSRPIEATCYEIEPQFQSGLKRTLAELANINGKILSEDFIQAAVFAAAMGKSSGFTHVIANPPYKKINAGSPHRGLVAKLGLETTNLYTCFIACSIALSAPGAQVVVIIPRSFMNGVYFKPFRYWLLDRVAITHIHVFESRDKAFGDDDVLQENVILRLVVRETQGKVIVSSSLDQNFRKMKRRAVSFSEVVMPEDQEQFIHIATTKQKDGGLTGKPLREIGLDISTGPVVDFRLQDHLRMHPGSDTVPLLYSNHFKRGEIDWPVESRKPNAIVVNTHTAGWLMRSSGFYVVTRRFTSKEEHRRVQAFLVDTAMLPGDLIGFENHLNVFHCDKRGMAEAIARGLVTYLNSDRVEEYFRTFSGHTQINATDLRRLNYPTQEELRDLSVSKITEALSILVDVGMPRAQQNERSALCLLAICKLTKRKKWGDAEAHYIGITPIMEFARDNYGKKYAPNTRETIRRQTMHQFCDGGLAIYNPDKPDRPVNSPHAVYQVSPEFLALVNKFGTPAYKAQLQMFLTQQQSLVARYAQDRQMQQVPLLVAPDRTIQLSPGAHSLLIRHIVEVFGPRYAPGGTLIYAGDTGEKWGYFDKDALAVLGVQVDAHGKMPDVVIHFTTKNWLLLIESVTSHGPVDGKRHDELKEKFSGSAAGLVFVTAFPTRSAMAKYLPDIAWETEVWCAESPTHLIHFNGERFLGPY